MKNPLRTIGAVLFGIFAASTAQAGASAVGEQSASAAGQGGTGAARANDPSAAWYNPAALADGEGWRSGAGLLAIQPSVEARGADANGAWSSRTVSPVKTPPHVYLAYARRNVAGGLSVNVPFGTSVMWPEAWQGRYEAVDTVLQVVRVAPFGAARFGRVRVAAGPHADFATLYLHKKLDMVDTEGDVQLDFAGQGIGAHAALFVDASDAVSFGFVAKSRTVLAMKGTADFEAPDAFAGKAPDQNATTGITVPDLLSAGVSFRANERVTLEVDAGVATWECWDTIVVDFEDPDTNDNTTRANFETKAWLRAGGEAKVGSRVALRGGLVIDPSPAPARTLAPNAPDADRFGATVGLGVRIRDGVAVDAFYQYLHLATRESTSPDALDASYGGTAHFAGVGLRWQR